MVVRGAVCGALLGAAVTAAGRILRARGGSWRRRALREHAVLLEWDDVAPSREFIFDAEERLGEVIAARPELGELDGNEVGGGGASIYLYGPDCELLWTAIEPVVRGLDPAPTNVILRSGGPGRRFREVRP